MRFRHGHIMLPIALIVSACAQPRQPEMVRMYTPELAEPPSPIRVLLAHYTQLKFSGEQRTQLEQIDSALTARNKVVLDSARVRDPALFDRTQPAADDSVAARRAEERTMQRRASRINPYVDQLRRHQNDAVKEAMQVLRPAQRDVAKRILQESGQRYNALP